MTEAIKPNSDYYLPDDNSAKKQPQSLKDPEAFLKILVAQMKYQNPMEPQDSATFINQLTQMASMEQMYNVSRSMDNLASKYEMARYFELIGHNVSLIKEDELVTGKVGGVIFQEGEPSFYLAGAPDGERYTLEQIQSITGGNNDDTLLPYLGLVDKQVKLNSDNQEITGLVEKVLLENGAAAVQVDGEIYPVELLLEVSSKPNKPMPVPEEQESTL